MVDRKFNCTDLVQGVVEGLILRYQVRSFRGLVGSQGFIGTVGRFPWLALVDFAEMSCCSCLSAGRGLGQDASICPAGMLNPAG